MQQKATLPPNVFLAEFPPSLCSQDNSAQGIRINIDVGWGAVTRWLIPFACLKRIRRSMTINMD